MNIVPPPSSSFFILLVAVMRYEVVFFTRFRAGYSTDSYVDNFETID